ncbi:hypothetical protein D3C76_1789170 [compost metagenome]
MVTRLQVDIALAGKTRVEQHFYLVSIAKGRHGTAFAVIEQARQTAFTGQMPGPGHTHLGHVQVPVGR